MAANGFTLGAAGIGGLLGGSSTTTSEESGFGYGVNSGSSFNKGGSSSYDVSDSWAKTYGSEASARDILRTAEANEMAYQLWKENADFNKSEAQLSREWQEMMANTSYQRAVKDMEKAGLNRNLAALNTGAAVPSGATASSGAAASHKATTYADSESGSHSEGTSSSFQIGGSQQSGININMNSGKTQSRSQSLLHDIGDGIGKAIENAVGFKSGGSGKGF